MVRKPNDKVVLTRKTIRWPHLLGQLTKLQGAESPVA